MHDDRLQGVQYENLPLAFSAEYIACRQEKPDDIASSSAEILPCRLGDGKQANGVVGQAFRNFALEAIDDVATRVIAQEEEEPLQVRGLPDFQGRRASVSHLKVAPNLLSNLMPKFCFPKAEQSLNIGSGQSNWMAFPVVSIKTVASSSLRTLCRLSPQPY